MKKRSGLTVMLRLVGLVRPLTGYMCLAVIMGLIGHLCASFITILGGYALLQVLDFPVLVPMGWIFGCVLLFAAARAGLRYAEQSCNHFIAFKLLALIRDRVFQALRRLAPAKLEGRDKGNLISIITSDIELLEVFYAHTVSPAAIAAVFTVIMVLFIGSFHWSLGLLALLAYGVVGILIPVAVSRASGDTGMQFRNASGDLSGFVLDSLRGLHETIQYGQGNAQLARMEEKTERLSAVEEQMKWTAGRNTAVTNTVILGFDMMMLFASALLLENGKVDFAGVLIPTLALFSSFGPVVAMAALGSTLQNTFAAGNRVLDILEESPITEEITGKEAVSFRDAAVKNVSFGYGDAQILENVSMQFPEREIIGIRGRSGSGKSTLLKLMMRFWAAGKGQIEISGRPVHEINTPNLRDMESFVTQETHLFRDSIRSNIRIAKHDATDAEIEEACRKASVHDFIMTLPQGYDTPVGELGDTLSGGERQRLGLARAFLHGAPFLLLDEPTSNLDSLNESVILRSLKEEQAGKTVILVSHRESTMRIAHRVYAMAHGTVMEKETV